MGGIQNEGRWGDEWGKGVYCNAGIEVSSNHKAANGTVNDLHVNCGGKILML